MKISLNEIKKLVKIPEGIDDEELIRRIGARLVEVEGYENWGEKYQGIQIVHVESCEPIPDTHLHLCTVDAGSSQGGLVQVVCGAPNVHTGMFTAWIAPGCIIPATYGTDEPFEIGSRKLRGYESNGMLAAADELALGDDHEGIIEIDPEMEFTDNDGKTRKVHPGDSLADVFGLCDTILDIENKSLTHRPDCFGLIGFAREVAGILGVKFEEPALVEMSPQDQALKLQITIKDPDLCPRYSCAVVDFTDAPRSQYFTRDDVFLIKAGMRPISPIVDLTNILMLKTGQPLHAFDYDKFVKVGGAKEPEIIVRTAKDGEKLELLDGETIECDENDILITSHDTPVALAGAMGGANTAIDDTTTRILLESATFSLYHLRKTQMKHGIFSEAITRFTKGQPAGQTLGVLSKAITELGADPLAIADCYPSPAEVPPISVSVEDINSLLGTDYDEKLITKTLCNVGLSCDSKKGDLQVEIPYWRTDLHIKEDIIEEVGRLLGFDNIPLSFPVRPFTVARKDPMLTLKNRIRDILSDRLGAHEVLTYSFVSKSLQEKFGEDPKDSYEIVNSISPELECFRQSLTPSLLEKVYENQKAGYKDFALYELNQVSKKSYGLNYEEVPVMQTHLALVVTGDFYQAKAYYEELMRELGITGGSAQPDPVLNLPPSITKKFKLEGPISGFELSLDDFINQVSETRVQPLRFSRFPSVSRDLTVRVPGDTPYQEVYNALESALRETGLIYSLDPVSIYEPEENLKNTKNLSFHLLLSSEEKTLNGDEISDIMGEITKKVTKATGGEII